MVGMVGMVGMVNMVIIYQNKLESLFKLIVRM